MEVRFEHVTKRYGSVAAVHALDLKIKSGALHFILGPSGCGKTTSLRMLAGLESVSDGRIYFDGRDVTSLAAAERGIGMVFQNYALWPHMSVLKNIEYGLKLRRLPAAEVKKRLDDVLDFTQLTRYVERLPGQLSGGQQQRVALARALAIRPNVLLLDEPLSNLDAKLRLEMRENISRIHKQTGITTVYVTHDQKEALSMGTEISIMHAGVLVQSGTPRELYHLPKTAFIAGFIGETNLVAGKIKSVNGHYEVETPLGILKAALASEKMVAGDQCLVAFRPEAVKPLLDGDKGSVTATSNVLGFTLEHLTYLGESEQFLLRGESGNTPVKASLFNPPEFRVIKDGGRLRCAIEMKDVLVLPPQQDLGART